MSWKKTTGQSYNHGHSDILTPSSRDGKPTPGLDDLNGGAKMAKLLDCVRDRIRVLHYSIRTEDAYV
jgi:hypothetical protein